MPESDFQPSKFRHFIYVAEPDDGRHMFYGVMTIYWETDALNAKGQVWRFVPQADGEVQPEGSLNTNDNLNTIWASPENSLWVGSGWGNVWTTASVPGDPSRFANLQWTNLDPSLTWVCTELPKRPNGGAYSVSAIWGNSDRDLYVGTFSGVIFHWNGTQWRVAYNENQKPITRIHGSGTTDVWAVGRNGLALHFDGHHWRSVALPGDAGDGQMLTGVWALSADEVYICSTSGVVFHGSQHSLERLGEYAHSFYGIVEFQKAMFLAAGDAGVAALRGNKLEIVRGTFASTGVYRLPKRLAFVQPMQDEPAIIIYDPANAASPWMGHFC